MVVDIKNGDMHYDVFCDDVKVNGCVRADSDNGEVFYLAKDKDGEYIIENDEVVIKCITGKVKIVKQ